jgi:hypothetical protein
MACRQGLGLYCDNAPKLKDWRSEILDAVNLKDSELLETVDPAVAATVGVCACQQDILSSLQDIS